MKAIALTIAAFAVALGGAPASKQAPLRNGVVRTLWPNGRTHSEVEYRNGEYHGTYRTWYESGHPYEVRHYRAGHEDGRQQAWTDDGELYINYEVKHGRHFGLVNATPCVRATDDATAVPYYGSQDFSAEWRPVAHRIANFSLTRQDGAALSERDLDGRIHVASFVYTKCAAVCPILISQLLKVQEAIRTVPNAVMLSYSVTPDTDTPAVLSDFGHVRGIDPRRWWLVTGDRAQIYGLARRSYFADDGRVTNTDEFLHTEKVLLVDGDRRLRGVYNGTQPHQIDQLITDIQTLARER